MMKQLTLEEMTVLSVEDRVTIARNARMLYRSQRNSWSALISATTDTTIQTLAGRFRDDCQAVIDAIDATRSQFADSAE